MDTSGRVSTTGSIDGTADAYWLVQSQSWSSGFEAVVDGVDLGVPALVNGFATGWLVAEPSTTPVAFDVEWTPQRVVWGALALCGRCGSGAGADGAGPTPTTPRPRR